MTHSNPRETWESWSEITRLVDTAWGLALLADYECAECIADLKELEAARAAPMSAARYLLKQAAAMLVEIEPNTNSEGTKS